MRDVGDEQGKLLFPGKPLLLLIRHNLSASHQHMVTMWRMERERLRYVQKDSSASFSRLLSQPNRHTEQKASCWRQWRWSRRTNLPGNSICYHSLAESANTIQLFSQFPALLPGMLLLLSVLFLSTVTGTLYSDKDKQAGRCR